MKGKFTLLLSTTIAATFLMIAACAPIYKCGEPVAEKKKGGKRLQAVVHERDSLCTTLSTEQARSATLQSMNADLQARLKRESSAVDEYGKELDAQSQELRNKERRLREMERIIARQDSITRHLNRVIADALLGFDTEDFSIEIRDGKVYVSLSDKLLFKSGSATVEAKGVDAISRLAAVLNNNPDIDILVEGHTDNVPIKTAVYKDNWDLSVARATVITRLLSEKYGVVPTRLTASGRGEFYPRATNETAEGKARNRRTEIILSPKLDELMKLLSGRP